VYHVWFTFHRLSIRESVDIVYIFIPSAKPRTADRHSNNFALNEIINANVPVFSRDGPVQKQ